MLIFDIETKTLEARPNPEVDIFKYIGFYDYEAKKYYFYSYEEKDKIKKLFQKHRVLIGFNSRFYDEPILKRFGLWNSNHLHLDLLEIIKKRSNFLGCANESKSLRNLAKFFKMGIEKGELDYSILCKDVITAAELELIKKYTLQDIRVTKKITDYVFNYFLPFKEYLNKQQNRQFYWVTSSIAAYAYKVICNLAELEELYNERTEHKHYDGGFVAEPAVDEEHNDILLFDFTSLYPFNIIQNRLLGGDGKVEDILLNLYKKRVEYKEEGDSREHVIKIIINSFYGMLANPVFANIYNFEAAKETTRLGREYIKLARRVFASFGFKVLYTDTDSVYIKLMKNQTKEMAVGVSNEITRKIQTTQKEPSELFKFKLDEEIKHIFFFKNHGGRLKKMYIYVTEGGRVEVKGLPMIKGDSSNIGLIIFNKYIKEKIIRGERYVEMEDLMRWVYELLETNINLAIRTFNVRCKDRYKLKSSIQYKISEEYGAGRHRLIGNKKFGVGCSTKFCTLKEFKANKLTMRDIDLSKFWGEINFFLKTPYKVIRGKPPTKRKKDEVLLKWI